MHKLWLFLDSNILYHYGQCEQNLNNLLQTLQYLESKYNMHSS